MYREYPFKEHDFYEVVRLVDKAQAKIRTHLMSAEVIRKCLWLFDCLKPYTESLYVSTWSCYSFEGFQFKSQATYLLLSNQGGIVKRCEAPETRYAKGDLITVQLQEPKVSAQKIQSFIPSYSEVDTLDRNHLLFTGN